MNLRKANNYSVGLDLGTNSVGWAVVDENGELYHFKGKPTWGSRLFPEADPAADTRLKRGQRRRYQRRRQRIDTLQVFFLEEMAAVDPDFFVRLRQSRLLREDKRDSVKEYRWPLFNDPEFTESDYYRTFPTIYHLRKHLIESDEKEDIRLVYLALHHIVKYRGNFLHEDQGASLTAKNANAGQAAQELADAFCEYLEEVIGVDVVPKPNVPDIERAIDEAGVRAGDRVDIILSAFGASDRETKGLSKLVAKACVGHKVNYANIFEELNGQEGLSFSLKEEEKVQEFVDNHCPDDGVRLFEALQRAYSSLVLSGILRGANSLSEAMIAKYRQHQDDLLLLKGLFRDYLTKQQYDGFFRGATDECGRYDINQLEKGSYTSYVLGEKKANKKGTSHEELIKTIRALCNSNEALKADERYKAIEERLDNVDDCDFLAKLKTRDNGTIPYQLHLEEMDAILTAQGRFYPFLIEHCEDIKKLVSSRIPYYVGPLNGGHDPNGPYASNRVNPERKFGWSVRRPGMESVKAYPWNVDDVIDTDKTAELFIQRMTGTCSYLFGEPVLPRRSLLYEEFCVLNELNGVKWCPKGGKPRRFDSDYKHRIFENLFKGRRTAGVSYGLVKKWLLEVEGIVDAEVVGAQGETGLESRLATYHDFCNILGVRNLEEESPLSMEELEEIVLWNTVFEDRDIFKRKLRLKYGPEGDGRLTNQQIKKLVNKRYTGWGRLSRKLLVDIRVPASVQYRYVSIMDVLRDGDPYGHMRQLVFMEALNDRNLCFADVIDEANKEHFDNSGMKLTIDDLQGSPANRRAVNQAMRILDEIVGITGHQPTRICIEVTRDDDWSKKGKRTSSRYESLKAALKAYKADLNLLADLDERRNELDNDRLLLYFEQLGKCMYTGERLEITQLASYQIDHILPQSYIKDDSIDNRVLVKSRLNQRKLDTLLLDEDIIRARYPWWKALCDAGLISEKKFDRLTCRSISERQVTGFINRQLVETSQVVKFTRQLCEQKYPAADVVSVRANTSHGVRDNLGIVKIRELNNYHHAHDAFLACQVADFVSTCYPKWQDGFSLAIIRKYLKELTGGVSKDTAPGKSGFIADSMTRLTHVDERTGEVLWDNTHRCGYIRKALGYRDCFISRMPEVQTGAFWDETVYSPRDTRNARGLKVPLKSSKKDSNFEGCLDPKKYGGVSSVKQAYWFIFAAKDKRGKYRFFFEGVPIYLVGTIEQNLQEYADGIAASKGCDKAVILRKKVPLRQKFELDGTPYYLYGSDGGSNEVRPATELCCSSSMMSLVSKLMNSETLKNDEYLSIYRWLTESVCLVMPRQRAVLKLDNREAAFFALTNSEKEYQLKQLIGKLNGTLQTVDIHLIGGSSKGGKLRISISSSVGSITWIDQSVTGMYERHTTFKDLCRGL